MQHTIADMAFDVPEPSPSTLAFIDECAVRREHTTGPGPIRRTLLFTSHGPDPKRGALYRRMEQADSHGRLDSIRRRGGLKRKRTALCVGIGVQLCVGNIIS